MTSGQSDEPDAAGQREHHEALARAFLARLAARDVGSMEALLAADAVVELPYGADNPRDEGLPAIHARFAGIPGLFRDLRLVEVTFYPLVDPDTLVAEYRYEGESYTGRPYRNRYVAFFAFRDGQITLWREYFNPGLWPRPSDRKRPRPWRRRRARPDRTIARQRAGCKARHARIVDLRVHAEA